MKKLILTLGFLLLLSSCAGAGDWTNASLPDDYVIFRTSSANVVFGKKDSEGSMSSLVETYVAKYAIMDKYILLQQVEPPESGKEPDLSNPLYFIVNIETGDIIRDLTENEYIIQCEELNISESFEWKSSRE